MVQDPGEKASSELRLSGDGDGKWTGAATAAAAAGLRPWVKAS